MEYSVQAKENSRSGGTGKDAGTYSRGCLVIISSSLEDTWALGQGQNLTCNANGIKNSKSSNGRQTFNNGTLVGSIDGGESFFPVGTHCQLTITTNNTQLKLYCWDSDKDNNNGAISVYIQSCCNNFNE